MFEKVDIEDDCNKNELSQKLTEVGIKLLVETIPLIFDKKISYSDQDDNDATYANKISSLNRKINFYKSVNEVLNLIRAHSSKPGAWFTIQNERIKIIKARNINHRLFIKHLRKDIFFTDFDLKGSSNYAFQLILKKRNKEFN